MRRHFTVALGVVVCIWAGEALGGEGKMAEQIVLHEDFSSGMTNWWVEGGEKVWVQDGRLHVKANAPKGQPGNVCTVWCRKEFGGNVRVEFDCQVVESLGEANNVNFFLCYSDPSGKPLHETRESRADAAYKKYHDLNGYVFAFLNDAKGEVGRYPDGSAKARFRMRRCPGFKLIIETFDYHCHRGVTYHVTITQKGGDLTFAVDGKVYMKARDENPHPKGLIGLRTFQTYLWWDNIKVIQE